MPILTLIYDTGSVPIATIINAVCKHFSYQVLLSDGSTNPETPAQFAKRMIGRNLAEMVRIQQNADAIEAANINPITLN